MSDNRYYKIDKSLRDIRAIHESIIASLKTQKARSEKTFDKYKDIIRDEMNIPSNKFLSFTAMLHPFMDAVIETKVNDYELIKKYDVYVKTLHKYYAQYSITEEQVDSLRESYEKILTALLRLENKHLQFKKNFNTNLMKKQIELILVYQNLPKEMRNEDGCVFCGVDLEEENSASEAECINCAGIPKEIKPDLGYPEVKIDDGTSAELDESEEKECNKILNEIKEKQDSPEPEKEGQNESEEESKLEFKYDDAGKDVYLKKDYQPELSDSFLREVQNIRRSQDRETEKLRQKIRKIMGKVFDPEKIEGDSSK